jgi:transposase
VPRNWGKNLTLLSSMSICGMGPSLAVEGSTTREVFEAYLEEVLVPTLPPGGIVVMDNLSAHKGGRVREIVEGRGCELMYLPPYSPDLNPIEELSPSSRGACVRQLPALTRRWLRRWAQRSTP